MLPPPHTHNLKKKSREGKRSPALIIRLRGSCSLLVFTDQLKIIACVSGILKKFEEEELDDVLRKRLKDSSELPGALWHIYAGKDLDKIREFLQKV